MCDGGCEEEGKEVEVGEAEGGIMLGVCGSSVRIHSRLGQGRSSVQFEGAGEES